MPVDAETLFVAHPSPVYIAAASVLALFALGPTTSFIPLILLLATLRLYAITIVNRPRLFLRAAVTSISLGVASALANGHAAWSGTSSSSSAIIALVCLTTVTSAFVLTIVLGDAYLRTRMRTHWTQLVLFPTLWSTAVFIISDLNSLGYFVAWSPVQGLDAYTWLLPVLGPCFIDWIVGAWAVVASEITGRWITGPGMSIYHGSALDESTGQLVDVGDHEPQHFANDSAAALNRRKRRPLLYVCTLLIVMVIPSYTSHTFPLPSHSPSTVPLAVACALPPIDDHGRVPNVDDYLEQTRELANRASVVLWPEGAVFFESAEAKQVVVDAIKAMATLAVVGVAFEEYLPANETTRPGLRRNGLMLVNREGVKMEYFKRHLVPFVESYGTVPSDNEPFVYNYPLLTKRNARGKPQEYHITGITGSICMDFAHPEPFAELSQRPALILGPARTWDAGISTAMWEQAKSRAAEIGASLLWCDGGINGISGVATRGIDSAMQLGAGSWVRTIGLEKEFDERRTPYGRYGVRLPLLVIWGVFGVEWLLEQAAMRLRLRRDEQGGYIGAEEGIVGRIERVPAQFGAYVRNWRRGRSQGNGISAEVGERTSLLG